jgi:ABC-type multidrug transport system ATPase subunit
VRRLDLALALIGDPEVLFLDEPTTGFDPSARRDAWDMIGGLRRSGTTVLLTSHYLDDYVESECPLLSGFALADIDDGQEGRRW